MNEKRPVFVGQRLKMPVRDKTLTVVFREVFTSGLTQVDSPRGAVLIDANHVLYFFSMDELDTFERMPDPF